MDFVSLQAKTAFAEACDTVDSRERLIVCGLKSEVELLEESFEMDDRTPAEIIAEFEQVDAVSWFAERRKQFENGWEMYLSENLGEWPAGDLGKMGYTLAHDILTGEPKADLLGLRIKVGASWQIPAYLRYGGWNDCPHPAVHCAVWKYWEERFGAKIVGASSDVVEAHVAQPPASREQAIQLAWEQYFYCYDIVDQGVETISNLAASLLNHESWYFWWD